ncbi:MAG TPA: PQQ-binding-like beta-propeller repeat protein [Steroidobacteraceae bacterium]|nr:PQQ-binding-like beta-propeller repeat protein [Steroidobacteraceae bacterium]
MHRLLFLMSMILFAPNGNAADLTAFTAKQLTDLPVGDWLTNGGNILNQRYSPLAEINTSNVAALKADWQTHLNGSGVGPPFSGEAQPIVQGGVIYVPTGADDVFAIDVESGKQLWVYQSKLDKTITTVCCGWVSRGVAIGEGKVFLGRLDGEIVALDQRTGKEVWSVQAERWQDGFTITSAPLYYDGMIITGFAGGERTARGRVRAFSAKTGKLLWTFFTVPGPGEVGHDSWPQDNPSWQYGGAAVWQTPAVDAKHGLIYFSTGNAGPDFNGSLRKGDNLFSVSIVAIEARTGKYRWHFQQVHHDLWDYDSPSPVVLFDMIYNGQAREAAAEIGKTGWVYILDRVTGKPLIGIDEMPVPQEPRQNTAATQPFPVGDAVVPHSIDIPPAGFRLVNEGRIFTPYWDKPVVAKPGSWGGTNWPPSSYDPRLGFLFVCANDQMGRFRVGAPQEPKPGAGNTQGLFGFSDIPLNGIFAAVDMRTNTIVWRQRWKDSCYSGSAATAGDIVFTGRNDGRFVALDSRNGDVLWEFQTGAGVNSTASIFQYKGHQKVAIVAAGNSFAGSPTGDSLWMFSLDGTLPPSDPPQALAARASAVTLKGGDAAAGALVFMQYCAACHGEEGRGGHGAGPDITKVAALELVANTVISGKNNMPPFAAALTFAQIRDVAAYVATQLGK